MDNKITPHQASGNTLNQIAPTVSDSLILTLSNNVTFASLVKDKTALERKQKELDFCIYRYNAAKKSMELAIEQGKKARANLEEIKQVCKIDSVDKITIGRMIGEVCKQLNVTKNMNEGQIDFLVEDIVANYPSLLVDEMAFIFRQGILGKYGKTDFRLDAQIFHDWIKTYLNEINLRIHKQNESKMAEYEQYFDNGKFASRL